MPEEASTVSQRTGGDPPRSGRRERDRLFDGQEFERHLPRSPTTNQGFDHLENDWDIGLGNGDHQVADEEPVRSSERGRRSSSRSALPTFGLRQRTQWRGTSEKHADAGNGADLDWSPAARDPFAEPNSSQSSMLHGENISWPTIPGEAPLEGSGATRAHQRPAARQHRRAHRPPRVSRPRSGPALPRFLSGAAIWSDSTALVLFAGSALSLIIMTLLVANRQNAVPPGFPVHFSASGIPDRWGVPSLLWRLPLMAAMLTLMNVLVAWTAAPHDRFASRFALCASLVIQLVVWIAVLRYLY